MLIISPLEVPAMLPDLIPRSCSSSDEVRADVAGRGVALLNDVHGPGDLRTLATALGEVIPHRDSRPDGVTLIEDRGATSTAMAGFSCRGLAPHTDRSSVTSPPGLVLTVCGREPTTGGESLLADGQAVYDDLAQTNPVALEALCASQSAFFGGADGYLGSVFSKHRDQISIRLRQDNLVRFASTVTPHLLALRAAIERHTSMLPLQAGTGYVLNNWRWLHGRCAFHGPRTFYRVTASPRAGTVPPGFRSAYGCVHA